MALTLLQIVDRTSGEMGLSQPTVVVGSTQNQTMQLLALTQRLGLDLIRGFEWQRLVKAYVFQTTAAVTTTGDTTSGSAVITSIPSTASLAAGMVVSGSGIRTYTEILTVDSGTQITLNMPATATGTTVSLSFLTQDYALPSDYDRMVSETQWDRTNFWRSRGSQTSQTWQWIQAGMVVPTTGQRFRMYGNKLRVLTAPSSVTNFAYEYVSNLWVLATGGTAPTKSSFTVDTDTCIFPDDLMLSGLKYYFLKAKKLDFGVEEEDFLRIKSERQAQDVPAQTLSMSGPHYELVGPSFAEGSWDLD